MRNDNTIIDLDVHPHLVDHGREEITAATDPRASMKQAIRIRMERHLAEGHGVNIDREALTQLTLSQLYEWLGIDPTRFQSNDPDHDETSYVLDSAVAPAFAA